MNFEIGAMRRGPSRMSGRQSLKNRQKVRKNLVHLAGLHRIWSTTYLLYFKNFNDEILFPRQIDFLS